MSGTAKKKPLTAKQKLMAEKWMPLAYKVALPFKSRRPLLSEELDAAALYGLTKAVQGFDPNRGVKFCTYAWHMVKNTIISEVERGLTHREMGIGGTASLPRRGIDHADPHDYIREHDDLEAFEARIKPVKAKHRKILRELFVQGKSQSEVAKKHGVSHSRIYQIVKASGVKMGLIDGRGNQRSFV